MTTTETRTVLAELAGVTKTYGTGETAVHALRVVDLVLEAGQLVVVLGPSGSGKTTLLNVVGGIEPATGGAVVLGGYDLRGLPPRGLTEVRRRTVGFVFQYLNLVPTLTARENVQLVAELTGEPLGERVSVALDAVGLTDRADAFPAQLSLGQQQGVALARALVTGPRVLLADEPTGSLDLEAGRAVLALLQQAARAEDRTVVVVTHNQAIAEAADRVLRMRSGEIVDDVAVASPRDAAEVSW
ncbi:MAG: ABC transporter ATP-binding protein [Actinomycetes bacterium]